MAQPLAQTQSCHGAARMWRMETRSHSVRYEIINKEEWYDALTLVRDDRVSLMLVEEGRERQPYFIYADKDRSFRFMTS
jgi:hypothetical protein